MQSVGWLKVLSVCTSHRRDCNFLLRLHSPPPLPPFHALSLPLFYQSLKTSHLNAGDVVSRRSLSGFRAAILSLCEKKSPLCARRQQSSKQRSVRPPVHVCSDHCMGLDGVFACVRRFPRSVEPSRLVLSAVQETTD